MLFTLAVFILVLGVLIFVHELGHFLAAKAVGIGVPRFSIGFGPPTPLRFVRGETEYQVAWVPLGGYVKMASKEEQDQMAALEGGPSGEEFPPDKLFENKPLWARILVISAGVIMNALFAWGVYTALAGIYGRTEDPTTRIDAVMTENLPPAAQPLTEIPSGTRVTRVNDQEVKSWNDIREAIADPTSDSLRFELEGREPITVAIPGVEMEKRVAIADSMVPLWGPVIGSVAPGQPAAKAGLETGDRVVAIDGEPIESWYDMVQVIDKGVGRPLRLTVERAREQKEIELRPVEQTVPDGKGGERKVGRIGIGVKLDPIRVRFGPWGAIVEGGRQTLDNVGMVFFALKGMITGKISPKELGGPILIGQASGQVARDAGPLGLLLFMAYLSVNLAVLNLLPIPVLDGGHLVFLFLEGLRGGRPLSLTVRHRLTQVGFAMLLGIIALALFNDVMRVFTS